MGEVTVIILHAAPTDRGGPLTAQLSAARSALAAAQIDLFRSAGADTARLETGHGPSFGEHLAGLAADLGPADGLVVLGAGAVPRLTLADARRLVIAAAGPGRHALTNNRYSSDVCAVAEAAVLRTMTPLPGDNALPRWLAERAGYEVAELPGRLRLALDLDTPLDLALLGLLPRPPTSLGPWLGADAVPRLAELRALLADPRRELLVAGRGSSVGQAALERGAACRVRYLSEERGLRAGTPLAQRDRPAAPAPSRRPPRSMLGRLLAARGGPEHLASTVAELADGAIIDSRVLLADHLGADESRWPESEDRFASDLLRVAEVADPWLRDLTASAAASDGPILLGGHTLLGPGLPILLGG